MINKNINSFLKDLMRIRLFDLLSVFFPLFALFIIMYFMPTRPTFLALFPLYLVAIWLIVYKPVVALILIVIFTSTIFSLDAFPQPISLGQIGLYLPEILIVLLSARTVIVASFRRDFKRMSSPLTKPILILFLWIIFSAMTALLSHRSTLHATMLVGRSYIYYANFFLVLYYLNTKEKINLFLKNLIIIAGLCTILGFVQYMLGPDTRIFPWGAWTVYKVTYVQNEPTLARVMPTSISLIYMVFFPILVSIISGGLNKKFWYKIFIILAILSFFLTFTRNVYFSVMFGVFLIWMNFKGRIRRYITRNIITTSFIVILLAYIPVFLGVIKVSNWWHQLIIRHSEFTTAGGATETLIWRTTETQAIMIGITKSLVLGNGIGATYYHPIYSANVSIAHNGFLSVIFQLGLIGLFIFLLIFYRYITYGIKAYRNMKDGYYKSLVLGFLIAFIALMPAIFVKPVLVGEFFWISLLGITWAFPHVIFRACHLHET